MEAGAALVRMPPMPEPVCLPRVLVWAELSINRQKIQCVCEMASGGSDTQEYLELSQAESGRFVLATRHQSR